MTEALQRWILERTAERPIYQNRAIEFWISEFCDELKKRYARGGCSFQTHFEELRRELLGEK